ncbi:MAG TPA: asparaginase [Burkholderiales bacterium]|nr:asparaginase [Burkholderiales bacterium]
MATSRSIVYVIGTGGSISCIGESRTDFLDYGYADRHYTIDEMLARLPELAGIATVRSEQLTNVGSGELSPAHWLALAKRINAIFREAPEASGVAVTHGTATLEETAYFLNLAVRSTKPVVVTGAMRPMTAISNDADLNLFDAVRIAATEHAANRGVLVILNNQIHAAREVTKSNTSRLDTFKTPDLGYLGYADSDGEIVFYREGTRRHTARTEFDVDTVDALPRVDIAYAYAGADGTVIEAFAKAGCRGLVAAGLGSGSTPRAFTDALTELARSGVPVVVASHSPGGRVMARRIFTDRGLIPSDNLQPRKARILLMLALTRTRDPAEIARMFRTY